MKKVFIKYNPYKLETVITVDGSELKDNIVIRERAYKEDTRLQEWIEELPEKLCKEYNDNDFLVEFHGTLEDFSDVREVFTTAYNKKQLAAANIKHIPAKDTSAKEKLIYQVFKEIQNGPFKELKDPDVVSAFENAQKSEFEVCVVATMSAGKSTLINSMLGQKLMPSKQEACTAIVKHIKDKDNEKDFKAEVFDNEDERIESHDKLTYSIMNQLNSDERTATIKVEGDIPFVKSDEISLVLIDTPGPNNARNKNHGEVQGKLLGKASKALVLYVMTGKFGTNDDDETLRRVAKSMSVGGKQSKDRFIFVVNKLDKRKKEDGDVNGTLERVRDYLKDQGIENPNLFPAAALTALDIRLMQANSDALDEDDIEEVLFSIRKLNRNEKFHFDEFATLPGVLKTQIKSELTNTKSSWSGDEYCNPNEALIHSGVISVEAAIRQYIEKYAKTAKIKNIVDTFIHKLDEFNSMEEVKKELAQNEEKSAEIVAQIKVIREKIADAKDAKKFKDSIAQTVSDVNRESKNSIDSTIEELQNKIRQKISEYVGEEIEPYSVDSELNSLKKFCKNLEKSFKTDLDELIRDNLLETSTTLYSQYKEKLKSLTSDLILGDNHTISINPLNLIRGSFDSGEFSKEKHMQTKRVKDGQTYVKNENKKWYKFWTWGQEKGHYEDKYKDVNYINGESFVSEFFSDIEEQLYDNGDAAYGHALQESKNIKEYFDDEFAKLDKLVQKKLDELEGCANDKESADVRIKNSEYKLAWLRDIKRKVESILEI